MEEVIKDIIDVYTGVSEESIIEVAQKHTDLIADYMGTHVSDYDWLRDLFYWADGSIGITYITHNLEIKHHLIFKHL